MLNFNKKVQMIETVMILRTQWRNKPVRERLLRIRKDTVEKAAVGEDERSEASRKSVADGLSGSLCPTFMEVELS